MCYNNWLLYFQAEQLKDAALHQNDSDLEKKRREADALLQSMGIGDAPSGRFHIGNKNRTPP